ncbi:hypothetical protein GH733_017729 [Mirounga leonina]|nr:hypothetical protein GH733_017729 [Mirounga leonina]
MEENGKINQKTTNGSRGKERMFGNHSRTEFSESSESTLETLVGGLMAQPAPPQYSRSLRDVMNPSGWGPLASRCIVTKILPDSEAFQDVQGKRHRGKHKFKVKEMYLTKLLSTKVAIHSVLEKLFRSIWSLPNSKAPFAIKYFFDFLDAQAENKKITDPDVVHIWKTNSLPLRFWVNILKNPQFVFDIKKTPHIDGCLSVIAQAFMDAFSLTEQQLGKEAPTNKLLYAKDIPTYKEEVKSYYKAIRDLPPLSSSEMEEFLTQESKSCWDRLSMSMVRIAHQFHLLLEDQVKR